MAKVYGKAASNIVERVAAKCMRAAVSMRRSAGLEPVPRITVGGRRAPVIPARASKKHHLGVQIVRDGKPVGRVTMHESGGVPGPKPPGWGGQTYVHTEQKAIRDLIAHGDLRPGDVVVMGGYRPPCSHCQGAMNDLFRRYNGEVLVRYDHVGGVPWMADGGRGWKPGR